MDITLLMRANIIVCVYINVLIIVCFIISLYGGSHASDVLHVLMGVSVA